MNFKLSNVVILPFLVVFMMGSHSLAYDLPVNTGALSGEVSVTDLFTGRTQVNELRFDAGSAVACTPMSVEEIMSTQWDETVSGEFSVELRVELEHEKGIIATLASTIANGDANIAHMNMMERDAALSTVDIVLSVKDRVHLAAVIKRLRTIRSINKMTRKRS